MFQGDGRDDAAIRVDGAGEEAETNSKFDLFEMVSCQRTTLRISVSSLPPSFSLDQKIYHRMNKEVISDIYDFTYANMHVLYEQSTWKWDEKKERTICLFDITQLPSFVVMLLVFCLFITKKTIGLFATLFLYGQYSRIPSFPTQLRVVRFLHHFIHVSLSYTLSIDLATPSWFVRNTKRQDQGHA